MVKTTHKRELTAKDQRIIGQMLVEILIGDLTDTTLEKVRALSKEELPEPFGDLAKQAGGSAITGKPLARNMLIELRVLCSELIDPPF
jgi:hypothetical protein